MVDVSGNLKIVYNNIEKAAERGNKDNKDNKVSLIAVTKNHSVEEIQKVINENHFLLGENRVQELLEKQELLSPEVQWHLIGHLQRNKARHIAEHVKLIHSLESYRLAKEINKRMKPLNKAMDCLVQVNISKEKSKFGLDVTEVIPFIEEASQLPFVNIRGLMTMAPHVDDPEEIRPVFKEAYSLYMKLKELDLPNVTIDTLSMGMTNDYEIAVEEGSTMVRIGSAIFGPREYT